ncbi:phosphate transport system permease protein [Alsobacter metallidurans]|uniref:Phosphate transport system permease protein n=1 Tax=Alsobacter metallidurans TaxID=340221 RepID=A0A917I8X7_9HYPH|nr:phosphate ABC transporter permease subunit PstC [Alsobacter metallidurans]GGH26254.1 phosphate transport system permease protein [Alsobacter metallidurans]
MVDLAMQATHAETPAADSRLKALSRFKLSDAVFGALARLSAMTVLLILSGVILSLIIGSLPTLRAYGFSFLTSQSWNPPLEKFGAAPSIYGTLVTSAIAMLIAVPVGIGVAIFLTELCPPALRRPVGIAIELLAGIPSIIYGMWGFFVLNPFLQSVLGSGLSLFTAGLVLAIMVLPFISSITRDVFDTVPPMLKESAYGLGCTRWEVIKNVIIPFTRVGIIGGVMLALGRALGETMAVTFVVGNANRISANLLDPGTTISATIANQFGEAEPGLYTSSLMTLGLLLFLVTFVVLSCARLMLMRLERRAGA